MNFFTDEEKINSIEANRNAILEKERKMGKELPYDESSKFLGTLGDKKNEPWYLSQKKEDEKKVRERGDYSEKEKKYYNFLREFQNDSENYFKVMKIESQKHLKDDRNDEMKEILSKKIKKSKKQKKKNKKEKKEKKVSRKSIEELREERFKRETQEKRKEIDLLRKYELPN